VKDKRKNSGTRVAPESGVTLHTVLGRGLTVRALDAGREVHFRPARLCMPGARIEGLSSSIVRSRISLRARRAICS
jgi:hypothetical protein